MTKLKVKVKSVGPTRRKEKKKVHTLAKLMSFGKAPTISAKSYCVLAEGRVVATKVENSRREIASLTKIMTTHTALKLCE